MNRERWDLIKSKTNFNVSVYRRGLVALILSLLLSTVLGILIFYAYLTEPERDFYATSGVAAPVKLNPLNAPNMSSQALLEPDPPEEMGLRTIPD